jgi:Fe-S cluster assembly ATP-binding protein
MFEIKDLNVTIDGKQIIKGLNLKVDNNEIVAIMGPNGSGKSSFAHALMGHPSYQVQGRVMLDGKDILSLTPDQRSKQGLFLSFQHPIEIPGVTVSNFLRTAMNSRREKGKEIKLIEFMKILHEKMEILHIQKGFATRYLNEGFSGGEKKKMEILQMAMLEPKVAILDETDSGLDIDALKNVCDSINILKNDNPEMSLVVITHYQRMLNYLKPDKVCIMVDGEIIKCGGPELALELEESGYEGRKNENGG